MAFCISLGFNSTQHVFQWTVNNCSLISGVNCFEQIDPFKRQPQKIVKHTQTFRRQFAKNCLSVFGHFVILALKGLFYTNSKTNLTILFTRRLLRSVFNLEFTHLFISKSFMSNTSLKFFKKLRKS